jgi:hypothetical protein
VFENRVLRRIFGPKRDDVTGDWRKLHNEEPPRSSIEDPQNELGLLCCFARHSLHRVFLVLSVLNGHIFFSVN